MIPELRIDPEFESIIPSLSADEFKLLEENILEEKAIYCAIIVWNDVIVDGHNRYKIAKKHGIEFDIRRKDFANRHEAIAWICKNQLGRRNLTDEDRKYLIGLRYENEKHLNGGDRRSEDFSVGTECPLKSPHVTRAKIAEETDTTEAYVKLAGQYAKGVDAAEAESPGIKAELLSGAIKPKHTDVAAIAKAPPEDRPQMVADLRKPRESSSSKKGNAIVCTPSGRPTSEERKDIRRIVAELVAEKDPVGEDEILVTMDSAFCTMMETCDQLFGQFPGLRTEPKYRNKVIKIIQKPKQYLLKIESEMQ